MKTAQPEPEISRLVLGTAQLGLDYGVANKSGKPDLERATAIVQKAWENGILYYDTAQAYGNSEQVLGACFKAVRFTGNRRPRVISKIDPGLSLNDTASVLNRVDRSIRSLGVPSLWGLMLHREAMLDVGGTVLGRLARRLKAAGTIQHFGVSVYSPEKAKDAFRTPEIDMVQIPYNIFDQRAREIGLFELAIEKGKTIFVRSVYLQGLLLLDPGCLSKEMSFSKEALGKFHEHLKNSHADPKLLALGFVVKTASGALIVLGAELPEQVEENIQLYRHTEQMHLPDMKGLASTDPKLIDPNEWYV
jgi:aryl-alcohol dehydrogenase-like predicted oxidoreductase